MEKRLTRLTSLAELAERWGTDTWTGQSADRWKTLCREVEAYLTDSGELWEWEAGELHLFAGTCGLAVMKDGVWIREWLIGRS